MPQEIESPVASPRSGGFKYGDHMTVGGNDMIIVGTGGNGQPILMPVDTVKPDSAGGAEIGTGAGATGKAAKGDILSRIYAKQDKIAQLPEVVRDRVLDALYKKAIDPHIPKALGDPERAVIKQRFKDRIMGRPPSADQGQSPEDFARAGRVPHGAFGVGRAGLMEGLASTIDAIKREAYKLHYGDKTQMPQDYASRGLASLAEQWLRRQAGEQRQATAPYEARSKEHSVLGIPFTRADIESGAGKTLSSLPLDLATSTLVPGAAKGAKLLPKIVSGAGRGAVAGGATAPAFDQSVAGGAAAGGVLGGLFPLFGAPLKRAAGTAAKVATKAASVAPGASGSFLEDLEKLSQSKFQRSLKDLTPEQKIEVVKDAQKAAAQAAGEAKVAAKKAAEAKKVEAVTSKAEGSVKTRRAMDEAKAFQKRIAAFIKENKRAPSGTEMEVLRKGEAAAAPPSAAATAPTGAAGTKTKEELLASQIEEFKRSYKRDPSETELARIKEAVAKYEKFEPRQRPRESFQRSMTEQINETRKLLRDPILTPEEKGTLERRLADQLTQAQRGASEQFKVESPEAVKAAAAVADVSKLVTPPVAPSISGGAPAVQRIAPGVSGLSSYQQELSAKLDEVSTKIESATDPKVKSQLQKTAENLKKAIGGDPEALSRIANAERKAAERARSAATPSVETSKIGTGKAGTAIAELVSSPAATPEEVLAQAEEQFYSLTDKLEATGAKGKELAKNLNKLWKTPPKGISRQQIILSGEKALEMLSGGTQ